MLRINTWLTYTPGSWGQILLGQISLQPKCLNFNWWKHEIPDRLQDRLPFSGHLNHYKNWWTDNPHADLAALVCRWWKYTHSFNKYCWMPTKCNLVTPLPLGHSTKSPLCSSRQCLHTVSPSHMAVILNMMNDSQTPVDSCNFPLSNLPQIKTYQNTSKFIWLSLEN